MILAECWDSIFTGPERALVFIALYTELLDRDSYNTKGNTYASLSFP